MDTVTAIYRYPVKGLSGEKLDSIHLEAGRELAGDRAFAIAHGTAPFDPTAPKPLAKSHFLMLMRNERIAGLETAYDPATGMLTIARNGRQVARGNLNQPIGRKLVEQFFKDFLGDEIRGMPRVVQAAGHHFADVDLPLVSLINMASVRDLERVAHRPIHPLRFRGNIYLEGARPWQEFDWLNRTVAVDDARLKVIARIERCAATDVDPETALRDMSIPQTLKRAFGHVDMGVYAQVEASGSVAPGDVVQLLNSGS
ncbi:MAG: MOSC domain-containing protein [Minwuiales bacterium]|nr:MOSC domain-containing protein [Minwuiales bacterium]